MSYKVAFLGEETKVLPPKPRSHHVRMISDSGLNLNDFYLEYQHYSVLMHPLRRFPFYAIANIDGKNFLHINRAGGWKLDRRISKKYQWGRQLYMADKSDFDKGHMAKREDVQWGNDEETAENAARSTFYYTNAVPQVSDLNQKIWRKIEDYILHFETVKDFMKITVATGPVLRSADPEFVTKVKNKHVQIPTLFWKVVYYLGDHGDLHRTAFIANQQKKLLEKGIISASRGDDSFLDFEDAETYQTNVKFIEKWTGLAFQKAAEKYVDDRPRKLIEEETQTRDGEIKREVRNLVL